jgi:hypothetical protein
MRVLIGILMSSLLLVGCGGGGSDPPPPPTGAIRIVNGTSYPIDETYVAPSSSSTWGEIRNATDIPPSYSITIDYLTPGLWDANLVTYGDLSTYYAHAWDLNVLSQQTVEAYADDGDFSGSLEVTNGSAYSITALYVAPTGTLAWGPNQLSASVPSTSTFHLYDIPRDSYDVRCDYSVGSPAVGGPYSIASFSVTSITCY